MKSTLIDRLFVLWIAAALTLWAAALALLWAVRVDLSGTGHLSALAALLLAVWATAALPGRAARALQRVLSALKLQDSAAMQWAAAGSAPLRPQDVRAVMRLLAAASVFAAAGGLLSTGAVYAAGAADAAINRRLLLGPAAQAAARLGLQFVAMLPVGVGIGLTFVVTVLVRGGSGRDHYAAVFREWLAGMAAGAAVAAVSWWFGANLLGVALVAGVAVLAVASSTVQRVKLTFRPRRQMPPIVSAGRSRRRMAVAWGFFGLTAALAWQVRLLRDAAEAGPAAQACWVALSTGLVAWFLRGADRRSRPPGEAQSAGVRVGLMAGVAFQFGVGVRCLAGGGEAVVCGMLAAAAQVPLAALAAMALSRRRRLFASGGGASREYFSAAAAGGAAGLVCYLVAGKLGILVPAGLGLAVAGAAGGVVKGVSAGRWRGARLQWAGLGAALICLIGLTGVVGLGGLPPLTVGAWLTTASPPRAGSVPARERARRAARWRSEAVSAAERGLLLRHPGRWWLVAQRPADVAGALPAGLELHWSRPDPTAGPRPAGRAEDRPCGDFLRELAHDGPGFDGVLLAPMAADCPEAWRCYSPVVLARCRRRLHGRGVLMLRTQARAGRLDDALSVARAFADAAGEGWAVVALSEAGADLLLVAGLSGRPPRADGGAIVAPLARLIAAAPGARPMRLSGRGALLGPGTCTADLRRRLATSGRGGETEDSPFDAEPEAPGGD